MSTHYDAMLAKVDRARADPRAGGPQAGRRPGARPDPRRASPTATSWSRSCATSDFLAGDVSHRVPRRPVELTRAESSGRVSAAVAAAIALAERAGAAGPSSAASRSRWRNVVSQPQVTEFERRRRVEWWGGRDGYARRRPHRGRRRARAEVTLEADGVRTTYDVSRRRRPGRRRLAGRPRRRCDVRRGSSTRPTRWPAAACWRRCPARSSASRWRRASRSRPASRCSCSRR